MDKQGRILLSKRHIDFAGLSKDIVLVGANTKLELWDKDEWVSYNENLSDTLIVEGVSKYNLTI